MADFFKGLAGGFQTGLQFGGAMRDKEERERLREAMQMTPQEMQQRQATPEELGRAQAETQGLAAQDAAMFGLSPQEQAQYAPQMPVEGQRIGATQYGLGGQTFNRMPTQQEIQQARYGAMADVIAERDPARAMEMRQRLEDQAYQAQRRPLEMQGLKQGLEASDLTIKEQQRRAAEADKMTAFNTAYGDAAAKAAAEGRTLGAKDIATLAQTHKLSPSQENELIAGHVGRTEAEVKQFRLDVEKATQGKGFEQLIDLHKNDKRFGDGVHFVPEIDKKTGGVVLARVNEATGQVEARMPFKTRDEATAYLREEAVNPANAAIWLQNYKKGQVGIEKDQAAIIASNAAAGYHGALGKALGEQAKTPEAKLTSMQKALGRPLTEDEKLQGLGLVPKPTAAKGLTDEAKSLVEAGHYKDVPTAIEALKRGSVRDKDNEAWLKMEEGLVKNDADPDVIARQKTAFMLRRGYAPPMAQQIIRQGIDPTTRKPLTIDDVTAYNQTYPQTPVTPAELPWLAGEARRQGLIGQIPR